jgi:PAS domain S-box-containing protein
MGNKLLDVDGDALSAHESFLDQMFSRSNLIIAMRGVDGRVLRVSRRLHRLFDAVGVDPFGKTVFDILPRPMARRIAQLDQKVLETGRHLQSEEDFLFGGIRRTYLASTMPLGRSNGSIGALFTIATDVTAQRRNEAALRNAALAVSGARRGEVFSQLVRYLAATLNVDFAFIARLNPDRPVHATIVAGYLHGELIQDHDYQLAGTPCENVFKRDFEFISRDLPKRFPGDGMMIEQGFQSYAACPLHDSDSRPIGLIAIAHGQVLANRQVTESMLRIYSVRAAAELERQRAEQELRISEANYREIFENAEDSIFVHDFETGEILDVNPKACVTYGYSREEFRHIDLGVISSGQGSYTRETALAMLDRARQGEKVRMEWHRRNKDGSLHWDEVVVHRVILAGQRRILVITREITERMAAEQALRSSEEQYRAMFNASVDGVSLWDAEGVLVDVNPALCSMYGFSREEILNVDPRELIHPDHRHGFESFVETVKQGKAFHMMAVNQRKDGTAFDIELNGVPMDYQGRPHLLAFIRDITESKRRVDELRASEEQYRAIFNASADAMILFDDSGKAVDVNPAMVALYGYAREDLLSMDPHKRFHPSAHPVLDRFLRRVRTGWFFKPENTGRPLVEETREVTRDGRILELEAHLVAMGYQGRPHVLAIKRDITERKHRDIALRKSEDRLRATVAAALDCIISMDGDGRIIEFNPAAESTFGYAREAVLGKPLADLIIPPGQRAAHNQGMKRYQETGHGPYLGRRIEVNAQRFDGSEFPAELAIAAASGPEGDIFVGYLRDISEQRRATAEQERLAAQLRQAQKMEAIGHLTGGIAHDFNNILTSILGYTMMGLERADASGDETFQRYLQQIRTSGERARDLIRQMLTFSRGQRGEPRPLSLPRVVREAISLFRSTFPSSITFDILTDDSAPHVIIDPIQFEQVLMNLCINARDAMNGFGDIRIAVNHRRVGQLVCASCRQDIAGDFVELSVSDTGTGISPAVMESMFEPFYTTKEVGQGSGMGLSTTHGIVHEHGGHIVVENVPGSGARFRILFPPGLQSARNEQRDVDGAEATPGALTGNVMVVDDEASVRSFLGELLHSRGLNVLSARDGMEALELLNDPGVSCDVLITDQTMPKLSGMELARRARSGRPRLPVILISGFNERVTGRTPEELGVEAVMSKPVNHGELIATIRALLDRQGSPE